MSDSHLTETLPVDARPIEGFPNYMIDPRGFVWSNRVYGSRTRRTGPWWRMKRKQNKRLRYWYVDLFVEVGKPQRHHVHLLVLAAFVGPKPEGMCGLHRDDDPENADLSNLYYGTESQNRLDAIRNGRIKVGENAPQATRFTNADIHEMRRLRAEEGLTFKAIGLKFGVGANYVHRICTRQFWAYI